MVLVDFVRDRVEPLLDIIGQKSSHLSSSSLDDDNAQLWVLVGSGRVDLPDGGEIYIKIADKAVQSGCKETSSLGLKARDLEFSREDEGFDVNW
jgi:hypothetical protein